MEEQDPNTSLVKTIRKDFVKSSLSEEDMLADPLRQFSKWLEEALATGNAYANAMTLSTVDQDGVPSSRIMLLRDVSNGGFTFFTNYKSNKANDLKINPNAALLFFWPDLERQARIGGMVQLLPGTESDEYFDSRPLESRVGAHVSKQSKVITGRKEMDDAFARELEFYKGKKVPRPEYWGGYLLIPSIFEFWQGRASRLHDRIQYTRSGAAWKMERLMP
jgi:pyridoxamine 5'-phosphate oxidase